MRFACQSCGKAYNLPEEKIADKSNVKLKCRVCGAIVEVKRQGEVVAQMLVEADIKRGRVSEAPAPLNSLSPEDMLTSMSADDDSDDATHAIAVGDQILSESGSGDDAASALLGHVRSALGQRGPAPHAPAGIHGFWGLYGFWCAPRFLPDAGAAASVDPGVAASRATDVLASRAVGATPAVEFFEPGLTAAAPAQPAAESHAGGPPPGPLPGSSIAKRQQRRGPPVW